MKRTIALAFTAMSLLLFSACSDLEILSPPGPEGKNAYQVWVKAVNEGAIDWNQGTDLPNYFKFLKGDQGESGKNAYDVWKDYIKDGTVDNPHNPGSKWESNKNSLSDFYYFITGAKGEDGTTPIINNKGNWQIGDIDTGIPAKGQNGRDGADGQDGTDGDKVSIVNDYWHINGENTGIRAKGQDGTDGIDGIDGDRVEIINGYWYINGEDTGVKAQGQNGKDGDKVEIVGGYWYINGSNTGVPATGPQGADGKPGSSGGSAYQIWVGEVLSGRITDKNGNKWPTSNISLQYFWDYLRGADGSDGTDKERTILSFVSSTQNASVETFTFQTDAGAKVTMNYNNITISATANGSGVCTIDFPNSDIEERPVIVYAEVAGKKESYPMSVKVVLRNSAFFTINYHGIAGFTYPFKFADPDAEIPTLGLIQTAAWEAYVLIPFTSSDIVEILFLDNSTQVAGKVELDTPDDYSSGKLSITFPGRGAWGLTSRLSIIARTKSNNLIIRNLYVKNYSDM